MFNMENKLALLQRVRKYDIICYSNMGSKWYLETQSTSSKKEQLLAEIYTEKTKQIAFFVMDDLIQFHFLRFSRQFPLSTLFCVHDMYGKKDMV